MPGARSSISKSGPGLEGYDRFPGERTSRTGVRPSGAEGLPIKAEPKVFLSEYIFRQEASRRFGGTAARNYLRGTNWQQPTVENRPGLRLPLTSLLTGIGLVWIALRALGVETAIFSLPGVALGANLLLDVSRTRELDQGLEILLRREDKPYYLPHPVPGEAGVLELQRSGEDLVLVNSARVGIRVFQEGAWQSLSPGERRVLRHGEMFQVESESLEKNTAYRIRIGRQRDTFQLEPLDTAAVGEVATQAPLGDWLPVFRLRGPETEGIFPSAWKERLQILLSTGLDKIKLLQHAGERFEIDGYIREAHESYEAAVDLAEKELERLSPRSSDNRARAGEVYRALGAAYFALAAFWDRRQESRSLALENYQMARKYLEPLGEKNSRDHRLIETTRGRLFRLHLAEAELWQSLSAPARAAENYEAAADAAVGAQAASTRLDLLRKSSRAFVRSDPPRFEDFARVMQKIHEGE